MYVYIDILVNLSPTTAWMVLDKLGTRPQGRNQAYIRQIAEDPHHRAFTFKVVVEVWAEDRDEAAQVIPEGMEVQLDVIRIAVRRTMQAMKPSPSPRDHDENPDTE